MSTAQRSADTAPTDRPILVWVRDLDTVSRKPIGWRMGRCSHYPGMPPHLLADGYNGDWDIPFWAPLPCNPE